MGVYLPNVDMPKGDKVVTIQICQDGSIWQQYRGTVPNAKAVPVPAHGRLIDADALIRELQISDEDENNGATLLMAVFLEVLKAAPTIIPAEEGE